MRHDCLDALTRQALNNLVNGKSGGARVWLDLQMDYDLTQAIKREKAIKVKRVA